MSFAEILLNGGGAMLVILTLVQIAPIRINPWSFFARVLGNAINHDLKTEIQSINKKVDEIQELQVAYEEKKDKEKMDDCRSRILRFGDECRRDVMHSKEFFDQILNDITKYENYCKTHPDYENSKAVLTIEKIKKIYNKCYEEDLFL